MFEIGNFLVVTAVALALIMVGVDVYRDIVTPAHWQWQDALGILQFVLVLLVASIPVAMPAVFSITMALGALALRSRRRSSRSSPRSRRWRASTCCAPTRPER